MKLNNVQIQGSHVLIKGKIGLQSTNPIALLSKYPAKAIEGSRLNWKIYLDDSVDRKAISAELY